MTRIDTNKNGYIDYTEFITANLNDIEIKNTERLRLCFKSMDRVDTPASSLGPRRIFRFVRDERIPVPWEAELEPS